MDLTSTLHFDVLLVPGTWIWCQILEKTSKELQWRLGRIIDTNTIPGYVLVDVLLPRKDTHISHPKKDSDGWDDIFIPQRTIVSRSVIVPYDSSGTRNQGHLAREPQPHLSLTPARLDDLSFLFSSHPVSFASLLCDRLSHEILHTSVGPQVLISLNPFRSSSDQDAQDLMLRYWTYTPSQLDPHSLLIARSAYNRMLHSTRACPSQSIVLIGPSGGGRAYTAIHLVQFLLSRYLVDRPVFGEQGELLGQGVFVSQVEAAISVLLAFTQRSRDFFPSSSFAGLIYNLTFDSKTRKHVKAVKVGLWATDPSSLSSAFRHRNERLPHIIYHVLISVVALEAGSHTALEHLSAFDALAILKFLPRPIPDDKGFHIDNFRNVISSLRILGFSETERSELFSAVFAVALSDAAYTSRVRGRHLELNSSLTGGGVAATMGKLLGLPDMTLEFQEVMDSHPKTLSNLSICLYERLLDSLIERINLCLSGKFDPELTRKLSTVAQDQNILTDDAISLKFKCKKPSISVIYGPGFVHDSLNVIDLLRNASDDVLVRWFTTGLLETVQKQYMAEGVLGGDVESWSDTTGITQLWMSPKSGIFTLLENMDTVYKSDEKKFFLKQQNLKAKEIRRMSLGDESGVGKSNEKEETISDPYRDQYNNELGDKFLKELQTGVLETKNESILLTSSSHPNQFAVRHLVGSAAYSTAQFATVNSTTRVAPRLYTLLRRSDSTLISGLFSTELSVVTSIITDRDVLRFSCRSSRLQQTIEDLNFWTNQTSPNHFIFCFTPNQIGQPGTGDVNHLIQLLHQYNLTPFCQMQQKMFPIQIPFNLFLDNFLDVLLLEGREFNKYHLIKNDNNKRRASELLLNTSLVPPDEYWIGHQFVFLQKKAAILFERKRTDLLERFRPAIFRLQRSWAGFVPRLQRYRQRQLIIRIQSYLRKITSIRKLRNLCKTKSLVLGLVLLLKSVWFKVEKDTFHRELEIARHGQVVEADCYRYVAAVQLQAWWRSISAQKNAEQKRLKLIQDLARMNILSVCRSFVAQQVLLRQSSTVEVPKQKAVLLQSHIRRWQAQKPVSKLLRLRCALVPIKRISSTIIALKHRIHMLKVLSMNHHCRKTIMERRNLEHYAVLIQKVWKGHFVRTQTFYILNALSYCQSFGLVQLHQTRFLNALRKIRYIQSWWRGILAFKDFQHFFSPALTKFDHTNRRKRIVEYLRREWSSINLLVFPLRLYQAQYYQSRLIDTENEAVQITRVKITKNASDVYAKSWAWPFLQILHHRARLSWKALQTVNTKLKTFTLPGLMGRTRLPDTLPASIDRTTASISYSCLTQMPRVLRLRHISVGGHHTLVMISEFRMPQQTAAARRHINLSHQLRHLPFSDMMVTCVYSFGTNDRGQLGNPVRTKQCEEKSNKYLIQPISLIDYTYSTSSDPITGQLDTQLVRSMDYTYSVAGIGTGTDHCIVLTRDGPIFAWGDNQVGQCGVGPKFLRLIQPTVVDSLGKRHVSALAVGPRHTLALTVGGDVYVWGEYHSVGFETIPPKCHVYYPIQVPIRDLSGLHEKCISVHSGHHFNVVLCHDSYSIKTWGRNDLGQLGNGQTKLETFPIELLISDIPKTPKAYLRIASISCGSNFVAACVIPSRGRLFLWGGFQVVDEPETPSVAQAKEDITGAPSVNPWLSMVRKTPATSIQSAKTVASPKPVVKPSICSMRAICTPTAVTHNLWKHSSLVNVTCGYTSSVNVVLDNGEIYGFEAVEPIWFRRDSRTLSDVGVSGPKDFVGGHFGMSPARYLTTQTSASNTPEMLQFVPFSISALKGSYHLNACVFQYRHIRSPEVKAKLPFSTFNNFGFQVDYALTSRQESYSRVDVARAESIIESSKHLQSDAFESLSAPQIRTGATTCMSLFSEQLQRPKPIDPRLIKILEETVG